MAGTRHQARIITLQALYEIDSAGRGEDAVTERVTARENLTEENRSFVRGLISGAVKNREEIDKLIQTVAPAWPVDQIALIDRNILRLAIFEILYDNKVPAKVAVNEAVKLAKTFGSDSSAKFVNGVLGAVIAKANR